MENVNDKKIKRLLWSVGIETFVKYFYLFKTEKNIFKIISEFEKEKEVWKSDSAKTKAIKGRKIIESGLESVALNYIIERANVNKIKGAQLTKDKAKELLKNKK